MVEAIKELETCCMRKDDGTVLWRCMTHVTREPFRWRS